MNRKYWRVCAVLVVIVTSLSSPMQRLVFGGDSSSSPGVVASQLAETIQSRVQAAIEATEPTSAETSVVEFESLAVVDSWTEVWPDAAGKEVSFTIEAQLWDAPIRAALTKSGAAFLPKRAKPYYIHDPIVLQSGQRLRADREAEIRLVPGANTCMLRNENLVSGQAGPITEHVAKDTHIVIEGGIWTTLATTPTQSNGNVIGRSARQYEMPSCHGVIILNSVRGVVVRHLVVRQSRAHGVQLSNAHEFLVEDVTFDGHRRDGIHVNGPASYGIIRSIRGDTGDDMVALNAWDWCNSAPAFGPIHHVLVENVQGDGELGGTDEIRLLPGTKSFSDGVKLECPVSDCVLRDLYDIRTFKVYDQPNLECGRDNDFSDPIGTVRNVFFCDLVFNRPTKFQVAANVDGLSIDNVQLTFDIGTAAQRDYKLVEIGPMSQTYKIVPDNPATWVELFSPDRDVTVRGFRLRNVQAQIDGARRYLPNAEVGLVKVADQTPNPDYPQTTPRGGTGKAIILP